MGAGWSAPSGHAEIPPRLLPFAVWTRSDLHMMRRRHAVNLRGIYALRTEHFARLLGADNCTAETLFQGIFDTDKNGLVDAFESMCAIVFLSSASIAEKVDFVHSLFDFSSEGDLGLAEVTMLLRTVLLACHKMDCRINVPSTDELEELARAMFDEAGVDHEGDLARHQFYSFLFQHYQMKAFLQLWSGNVNQVIIPEGTQWEDTDFPADGSSLYKRPGIVPPGLPPPGAVQWLRPDEVAGGDQVVLFIGDIPGDGTIVPGQLANQWLLSAMGILTGRPHLLRSLFLATGQEDMGRYGIRIFKDADWLNVFIDTRIPCDATGAPLFCRGEEKHELWTFLLEKAFAKAHGCYENLMHGDTVEALRDLTGGAAEKLQWALPPLLQEESNTIADAKAAASDAERTNRRPRLTGWGLHAGSRRPYGWIFDEVKERLVEGQVLGCSRLAWLREPWETEPEEPKSEESNEDESLDAHGRRQAKMIPADGPPLPLSNRLMRGLRSGFSYSILETFERWELRLLRLKDPSGGSPGTNPRQYLGDWGPSSPLWRTRPGIATELMPRTLPGTFWMDEDAFLEVFNTLYAVDLGTDTPRDSAVRGINSRVSATEDKRAAVCKRATAQHAASDPQEGRCGGSWGGENCGGSFNRSTGWVQGTQVFLHIDPPLAACTGEAGADGGEDAKGEVGGMAGARDRGDEDARVLITLTQEDSRYHGRDYTERLETQRPIGFLVHAHKWSTESKRPIPKLSKILQNETKHVTRPFQPRRDVSCQLKLSAGQYVVVSTTLERGTPGRFWVHVKSDHRFTLQPSAPEAAVGASASGSCDLRLDQNSVPVEISYNEAEEDTEAKGRTAAAANVAVGG